MAISITYFKYLWIGWLQCGLKHWGGENYSNEQGYVNRQAVSDGHILTANGSAQLEFAKELLLLLENEAPEAVEMWYQFFKNGYVQMIGNHVL